MDTTTTYYDRNGKQIAEDDWDSPLFVVKETARALLGGISPKTLDRMLVSGRLAYTKTTGSPQGRVLIPYSEILRLRDEALSEAERKAHSNTLPNGTRIVAGVQPVRFPEDPAVPARFPSEG